MESIVKHALHSRLSLDEEIPSRVLQVPSVKISAKDGAQDLFDRFSVEVPVQDPCGRVSTQGAYSRSQQISV